MHYQYLHHLYARDSTTYIHLWRILAMQTITAADYALFYTGLRMVHTLYYNGQVVKEFKPTTRYYIIKLSDGVQRTLRESDTLTVRNTSAFYV